MPRHPLLELVWGLPPTLLVLLALGGGIAAAKALTTAVWLLFSLFHLHLQSTNGRRRRIALAPLGILELYPASRRTVVGFFHPYCNAGGGGERVLWTAIAWLQRTEKHVVCAVYTGDGVAKEDIIAKVNSRFGIVLDPSTLILVQLTSRYLVEDGTWKRFTLLGQSLGSIWLALEGIRTGIVPDIWIDTMGYAFAYPLIKVLCRVPIGSYTHYPTISTDMLKRVASRAQGHTNNSLIARSAVLTTLKLVYYHIFAELYSFSLRRADVLMVNSSWTKGHIDRLCRPIGFRDDAAEEDEGHVAPTADASAPTDGLRRRKNGEGVVKSLPSKRRFKIATIVYPPCDTLAFSSLPLTSRQNLILSVAQFRPEKEHKAQLEALKLFFTAHPEHAIGEIKWKLILAGSVRNEGDEARVEGLRELSVQLGLQDNVEFAINVPYPELIRLFGQASIGLHTMIDEHFGITVVEIMAAGLIPLVHASAGPLLDIVLPYPPAHPLPTGFHSTSTESFALNLATIVQMSEEDTTAMRERARGNAVDRFSTLEFERGWKQGWDVLLGFV